MDHNTIAERLETLLKEERAALLTGGLARLPGLVEKRDRLIAEIPPGSINRVRLLALRELAVRNTDLARAARDGVRAAIARLAEIRAAAGPIESYSANGTRSHIGAAQPAFERKA